MKKLLAQTIIIIASCLFIPLSSGAAFAACSSTTNPSANEVLTGVGQSGQDCNPAGVPNALHTAVNILSYVAGAIAVIMIIYAGVKYMTSSGDSNRVGSAKTALVYAVIGVAIAVGAHLIVHYVINQANSAGS